MAAPLAFGSVDRLVQIALTIGFVVALTIIPPALPTMATSQTWLLVGFASLLLFKEFAPAQLFGTTEWRTVLSQQYGVELPLTHHPEPGRAVDALLAAVLAVLWFSWVRTLASHRPNRAALVWTIFGAGSAVAAVSFLTAGIDPNAIYGMRYTQSWMGFGPFPNRNHTACFLAVSAVTGVGCLITASRRKQWWALTFGIALLLLTIAALLRTHSRGGLLALGAGLVFLGLAVLYKFRSRRAIGLSIATALLVLAGVFAFGDGALERFSSAGGEHSAGSRILIWGDTLALWSHAPLFGHGIGTFASVFPLVQTITLDNQVVLHPESSWLQWLVELGAVPLLIAVGAGIAGVIPFIRNLYTRQSSFFLLAGALAGAVTLLLHAAIDVPAHRWGTAMLGLAALAMVCPARTEGRHISRGIALVPLGIATLWVWPLWADRPAWSPTTLARLLDRSRRELISERELRDAIASFPLNASLHQLLGAELLKRNGNLAPGWANHLQVAARLKPGSWVAPLKLARICRDASPGHSLHFWQMSLERAGWRRDELFARALRETRDLPNSTATWENYAESHPELMPVLAIHEPTNAQRHFERWWSERGASCRELEPGELQSFLPLARRFASVEQILTWSRMRHEVRSRDYMEWAALLHERGADAEAWMVLAFSIRDPEFPAGTPEAARSQLENTWRRSPEDVVNAQAAAHARLLAGEPKGMEEIVLAVGSRTNSPPWFKAKAAHLLARDQQYSDAVRLLLKDHP